MSPGSKSRVTDEIELLRDEVAELEELYRRGGPAAVDVESPATERLDRAIIHADLDGGECFFPNHFFRIALAAFAFLLATTAAAMLFPPPLEEVAKPIATDYAPRPEWHFLYLVQLLKYLPDNLEVVGIVGLPAILGAFLLFLPLLDRRHAQGPRKRPIATICMSIMMGAVVILTLLAAVEKGPTVTVTTAAGPPAPKPAPVGSVLYTKNCYNCHGLNFKPSMNVAEVNSVVEEGLQIKGMPAFGGVLTAEELHAVSDYVLSSQGAKLFAGFCAGCHGKGVDTGKSNAALSSYISEGNPVKGMPGYGRMLTQQEIAALAGYIDSEEGKGSPLPEKPAGAGSALYLSYCASCHGAKGDQIPKADLGSKAFRDRYDEARVRSIVAAGTPNGMPGFARGKGGSLTEQQIAELTVFLRFWEGIPPEATSSSAATEIEGKTLYGQTCSGCHGPNGDQLPPAMLNSKGFLLASGERNLASAIAQGIGRMPAIGDRNGGTLSDEQIEAIVTYLLKSSGPAPRP